MESLESRNLLALTVMPDSFEVLHDQSLWGDVLLNDYDPEVPTLTASLLSGPSNGTLTFNSDGTFTYDPNENFAGSDSFLYAATNGTDTGQATASISVTNNAPIADDVFEYVVHDQTLDSTVYATDLDGDNLTYTLAAGPYQGTLNLSSSGSFAYTPGTHFVGLESFTFIASDDIDTDTGTFTINVTNNAPIADDGSDYVVHGQLLASNVYATDLDSDSVAYAIVSGPYHGTVVLSASGSFTYAAALAYTGSDSFVFSASDGIASDTGTFSINVVNTPPTAIDGSETVPPGGVLNGTVTATDLDGDPITFTIITAPSNGEFSLMFNGSYCYAPESGFSGSDSFVFAATDGVASDSGTVLIDASQSTSSAPVGSCSVIIAHDGSVETSLNTPVAIALDANHSNNDPLTYEVVAPPQHGTIAGVGPELVYTPNAAFLGSDSFTFQATDGNNQSNIATITIGVVAATVDNQPPFAESDYYELYDDEELEILSSALIANDTDPENDLISFAAIVTAPTSGQLQQLAADSWVYIPNTGFTGTDFLEYSIADAYGNNTVGRVYLTVFRRGEVWGNLYALQYLARDLIAKEWHETWEENPGIGIRRNGADDNLSDDPQVDGDDDLLRSGVRFNEDIAIIQGAGYEIQLRRSNDAIQLWEGRNKTSAHFAAESLTTAYGPTLLGIRDDAFWVEWTSTDASITSSDLEVWFVGNGEEKVTDRLTFRPFKSLIVGYVGEHQHPGEAVGMNTLVTRLRDEGYDALIYDEDDMSFDSAFTYVTNPIADIIRAGSYDPGQGATGGSRSFHETVNAVRKRGVTQIGAIGYSHGGGATYEFATLLQQEFGANYGDFDLRFTAYIDAVAKQSPMAETRRPPESEYHVNLWQSGPPVASLFRLIQGADMGGDANYNDNVDSGADGGFAFDPDRRHTNRPTLLTGARLGIMETEELMSTIIAGASTPQGVAIVDGVFDKVERFSQ